MIEFIYFFIELRGKSLAGIFPWYVTLQGLKFTKI